MDSLAAAGANLGAKRVRDVAEGAVHYGAAHAATGHAGGADAATAERTKRGRSSTGGGSHSSTGSHAVGDIDLASPSFLRIRCKNAAFVDKTAAIADLLCFEKCYRAFFTRPRKFGKSLTLDITALILRAGTLPRTAEEGWPGYKPVDVDKLFDGLAVHARMKASGAHEALGTAHFVVILTLGGAQTGSELKATIINAVARIAGSAFGPALKAEVERQPHPEAALCALIAAVPEGVPVAVLVDEYDAAVVQDVGKQRWAAAEEGIAAIRSLLMTSKAADASGRITHFLVTGIARFARTSLFSGANNFADITADPLLSRAIGFTEAEMLATFDRELAAMRVDDGGTATIGGAGAGVGTSSEASYAGSHAGEREACDTVRANIAALASWYNSYCFDGETSCFNPYPVLCALKTGVLRGKEMADSSGVNWLGLTPGMVVESLWERSAREPWVSVSATACIDLASIEGKRVDVLALLLQVGLLTLYRAGCKAGASGPAGTAGDAGWAVGAASDLVLCQVPNEYARQSLRAMLSTALPPVELQQRASELVGALRSLDAGRFQAVVQALLQALPYSILKAKDGPDREAPFHAALWAFIYSSVPTSVAVSVAEAAVQGGRADIVITFTHEPVIWILELGVRSDDAMKREQAQRYAVAFTTKGLEVVGCGIVVNRVPPASASGGPNPIYACTMDWKLIQQVGSGKQWTTLPA